MPAVARAAGVNGPSADAARQQQSNGRSVSASSRPRFGPDPQRDGRAVVETGESLAWTPSASSALSASRIAELRRSLFIPCLPDEIELNELVARLTLLGNIQEIIIKRNQRPCQQMRLLMERSQLSAEERDARENVRRQLEATFRRIFRRCTVRLYGSSVNTFGVRGSDIDSFLDLHLDEITAPPADCKPREQPMSYYFSNVTQLFQCPYEPWELAGESPKDILRLMEKLLRYLAKSENYEDVLAIPAARTPILKLRHPAAHLSVDVSFTSKLVFENTGLLILYSHLEPRLRPLVLTLRQWADAKELTGSED
ncbi:speckle targeted PIP5K1A-regulated poly(A) polymerase-like [Paramacrobiotus metropolitanus]|uniref:speckle targeted PIP5K1A-regulated poly(A) polymerase-like n=1 Tax=Paramacrobiotus metropolitanus TaxID=2943436 RepID=UPI0024458095|nr:speckle targeted PIP5K1A-regulated poly(A) polymerase-like [Paramacrobiotus metropolitanus]